MSLRLPAGALLLTPPEARMLYQAARLGDLRTRHRVGDSALYKLLTDISVCAFSVDAASGNEPRHSAASDESGYWTTGQLARAARRAPRTVRKDIADRQLPATKTTAGWIITATDAQTYIDTHKETP